jgi:proteic killer suppression protein
MIRSFRHRGLKRLYDGDRGGVGQLAARAAEILSLLDVARSPKALDLAGYRLHQLHGKYMGFWSVRVTGNWRIIFRFEDGDARDVQLIDYH